MTTREFTQDEVSLPSRIQNAETKGLPGKYRLDERGSVILALKCFAGVALIFFGLTNTGSFYTTAGQFGGILATIFYEWQFGTLLTAVGSLLIYDSIKTIK